MSALEGAVALTDYESGDYETGGRRFDKIVRFATVDCVKAGWMLKSKGRWTLTEMGWQAYQELKDPDAFYARASKLYRQWRAAQPAAEPEKEEAEELE